MRKRVSLAICGVLGAIVTAGFAGAQSVTASVSGPAYLAVTSMTALSQNAETAKLSVTTRAAIPRQPNAFINSNPVVGLAWADLNTGKVFVTTIHPVIGRDSNQNPAGWHAHTATLIGGATSPHDFCVKSIDSTPTAGISIHGNTMDINVRKSALPVAPAAFDAAVGFTLQPDAACASRLAVQIST
jgi:hypothetical protein